MVVSSGVQSLEIWIKKCPGGAGGIHLIGGAEGTGFEPFHQRFIENQSID